MLREDVQTFITQHLNTRATDIVLKGSPFPDITVQELVQQIVSRKKAEKKLPTWFANPHIYYPEKVSIEQTSSEKTALYKSRIPSGAQTLIDITGGLGIDAFYFSKTVKYITHCEVNQELSKMAAYNFEQLNAQNIQCIPGDGLAYLKKSKRTFDWIYADPSRRGSQNERIFLLGDCIPDIPRNLKFLFECAHRILIKTSPLLDIQAGINELENVSAIHVVAVQNEVKELIWVLKKNEQGTPEIHTVNLKANESQVFSFSLPEEKDSKAVFGSVEKYIYEPNAAILKAGAFKYVGHIYQVKKLHPDSHYYTSAVLKAFPGRVFEVTDVLPFRKKELKKRLHKKKVNLAARNFPLSVPQLKKEFKTEDGGTDYVFFTTGLQNVKIAVFAKKLKMTVG